MDGLSDDVHEAGRKVLAAKTHTENAGLDERDNFSWLNKGDGSTYIQKKKRPLSPKKSLWRLCAQSNT